MRQVDVAARDRGQRKHAEDGLGLGNVGVRRGVIAGVLAPLGNGLGFQMFKDGVVFRMEGEEGLFARDQFHEMQDLVVLQFHAPLPVGCERLEGNDPASDQLGDGVVGLFHDVGGQGAVQPEVDAGTGFPFPDEVVDGLNQPALFAPCGDGPDVGDDGGDAAGQGRPRQAVDAVGIDGVVVRVDDAGQHVAPGGVDDPVGPHLGAAREEAFHPFPGNEDVQRAHGSGINDDAVCDQSRTHGVSPVKHPCLVRRPDGFPPPVGGSRPSCRPRRGSAEGRVGAVHLAASSYPRRGLRQGHCGNPGCLAAGAS